MSGAAEMAERHGRVLAELSELGLSLARDLHGRAMAAETPEAASELGLAFHRISRSVRQTIALEARLERDRQRHDREDRAEAAREHHARIQARKAQVRAAVERAIWTEAEGEEAERLLDDLDDRLDEEALFDGFGLDPLEVHIARIREELGLEASRPIDGGGGPSPDERTGGGASRRCAPLDLAATPSAGFDWRSSA